MEKKTQPLIKNGTFCSPALTGGQGAVQSEEVEQDARSVLGPPAGAAAGPQGVQQGADLPQVRPLRVRAQAAHGGREGAQDGGEVLLGDVVGWKKRKKKKSCLSLPCAKICAYPRQVFFLGGGGKWGAIDGSCVYSKSFFLWCDFYKKKVLPGIPHSCVALQECKHSIFFLASIILSFADHSNSIFLAT